MSKTSSIMYGLGGMGAGALVGGPPGAVIGGLAGLGADKTKDHVLELIDYAEDKVKSLKGDKDDKEDKKENKEEKEAQYMNDVYKNAFVERCVARGVDPEAVIGFAKKAAAKKAEEAERLQKVAASRHELLSRMTPYQQGFAIRCLERGVSLRKVAEFCQRRAGK